MGGMDGSAVVAEEMWWYLLEGVLEVWRLSEVGGS